MFNHHKKSTWKSLIDQILKNLCKGMHNSLFIFKKFSDMEIFHKYFLDLEGEKDFWTLKLVVFFHSILRVGVVKYATTHQKI